MSDVVSEYYKNLISYYSYKTLFEPVTCNDKKGKEEMPKLIVLKDIYSFDSHTDYCNRNTFNVNANCKDYCVILDENKAAKIISDCEDKSFDGDVNNVEKVIFNGPATIVFFKDGTKTVVECLDMDMYDKDKGLAFALLKKIYGNKFNDIFKKYVWEVEEEKVEE